MINQYIENLESSIQWAQLEDDLNVLCMARDQMDQLMSAMSGLSLVEQEKAQQHIDTILPMEWPLWMEACRYQDGMTFAEQEGATIH